MSDTEMVQVYLTDEQLAHVGVKGMKWGKRKGSKTAPSRTRTGEASIIAGKLAVSSIILKSGMLASRSVMRSNPMTALGIQAVSGALAGTLAGSAVTNLFNIGNIK
jgi:hypothetical protein